MGGSPYNGRAVRGRTAEGGCPGTVLNWVSAANLSIRMALRRFTRLTNAYSKKLDNLKAACALYFAYYNFCRVQQSLRVSPALEAGITDHTWTLRELLS